MLKRVQWGAQGHVGAVRARDGADLRRLTRPKRPWRKLAQPARSTARPPAPLEGCVAVARLVYRVQECGGRRGHRRGRDGSSMWPGFCFGTWCGRLSSAEQSPLPGPHLVAGLGADCWLAAPSCSSRISSVLAAEVTMVPEPRLAPAASASSPAPVSSGEKLSRAS